MIKTKKFINEIFKKVKLLCAKLYDSMNNDGSNRTYTNNLYK